MFNFTIRPKIDHAEALELRPLSKEYEPEAIELYRKRYKEIGVDLDLEGEAKNLTDIDYYWRKPGGEFMMLLRDGKLIGTIAAKPHEKGHAECDWFFLIPQMEGKGVSMYLLKWALSWCIANEIKHIELWSSERRWWAHKIYKKLGFVHNGVRQRYCETPPLDLLYFQLDLDEKMIEKLDKLSDVKV